MTRKIYVSLIIALVLILFAGWYFSRTDKFQTTPVTFDDPVKAEAEFAKYLDERGKQLLKENEQLVAEFKDSLKETLTPHFNRARKAIPLVVESQSGFKATFQNTAKMVKDKMKGTKTYEEHMEASLKPVSAACIAGNKELNSKLDKLSVRLNENYNRYCMDVLAHSEEYKSFDADLRCLEAYQKDLIKIQERLDDVAKIKFPSITAGVILELVTLRTSLILLRNVAVKVATSAGAAGVAALADGPLPFGDIVGATVFLGSMAWVAIDIYKISFGIPKEIRENLTESVNNYEKNLTEYGIRSAESMLNTVTQNMIASQKQ